MMKYEDFYKARAGHNRYYTSFMITGVTEKELFEGLDKVVTDDMVIGDGSVNVDEFGNGTFEFELELAKPSNILPTLTKDLNCIGYAYIDDWDNAESEFLAMKNGEEFDDYTANWEVEPVKIFEGDEMVCDASVIITDNESGMHFCCGSGMVSTEQYEKLKRIIDAH